MTGSPSLNASLLLAPNLGVVNHWRALEESAHRRLHHRRAESNPASVRPRTDAASQIQPQVARSNTLTLSPTIVFKGDRSARSANRSRPTPKSTPPYMIVDVLRPSNAPVQARWANAQRAGPPPPNTPNVACNRLLGGHATEAASSPREVNKEERHKSS